jgi:hypothetical protein
MESDLNLFVVVTAFGLAFAQGNIATGVLPAGVVHNTLIGIMLT